MYIEFIKAFTTYTATITTNITATTASYEPPQPLQPPLPQHRTLHYSRPITPNHDLATYWNTIKGASWRRDHSRPRQNLRKSMYTSSVGTARICETWRRPANGTCLKLSHIAFSQRHDLLYNILLYFFL